MLRLAERELPLDELQHLLAKALNCILRAQSIGDFARVGSLQAASLYSLDPDDYQKARQLILEAL